MVCAVLAKHMNSARIMILTSAIRLYDPLTRRVNNVASEPSDERERKTRERVAIKLSDDLKLLLLASIV